MEYLSINILFILTKLFTVQLYFENAFTQNVLSSIVMRLGNEKHNRKDNGNTVRTKSPIYREFSDKPTELCFKIDAFS